MLISLASTIVVLGFPVLGGICLHKSKPLQSYLSKAIYFVILPAVVFRGIVVADSAVFITLAISTFIISALMMAAAKFLAKNTLDILPLSIRCSAFSYYSVGHFGIPIAQMLYGDWGGSVITALFIGATLFSNTLGAVIAFNQGNSLRSKLVSVIRQPVFVALVLGICLKHSQIYSLFFEKWLGQAFAGIIYLPAISNMLLLGIMLRTIEWHRVHWQEIIKFLLYRAYIGIMITGLVGIGMVLLKGLPAYNLAVLFLIPLLPIAFNIIPMSFYWLDIDSPRHLNHNLSAVVFSSLLFSVVVIPLYFFASTVYR